MYGYVCYLSTRFSVLPATLYPEKGAIFTKPTSLKEMRNVLNKSKSNFAIFWTPVKKISTTEYNDEGVIRTYNDTTAYLGLKFDAIGWDDDLVYTSYGMV